MPLVVFSHSGELVASTVEIAAGTGVDHKNVIQLTRKYRQELAEFGRVEFEILSFETRGGRQSREVAYLNERQAVLLLACMRNNEVVLAFKVLLVKEFARLSALEKQRGAQDVQAIPRTFAEALRLAANLADKAAALQAENEEMVPKARFHDAVAFAGGTHSMQEAAKILNVGPNCLFALLRDAGVLISSGLNRNLPYQAQIEAGRFRVVERTYPGADETPQLYRKTMVTGKGMTYLESLLSKMALAA